jgi:hypothetical protein
MKHIKDNSLSRSAMLRRWIIFLLVNSAFAAMASAEELAVIANGGVELSADDIRDVYLGEKLVAGGAKLSPVDNAALQAQFLAKVMLLDSAKYQSVWTKKGFRDGLAAPASRTSDADVIAYVKRMPGAVGYVNASAASVAGVKILKKY